MAVKLDAYLLAMTRALLITCLTASQGNRVPCNAICHFVCQLYDDNRCSPAICLDCHICQAEHNGNAPLPCRIEEAACTLFVLVQARDIATVFSLTAVTILLTNGFQWHLLL